MSDHIDCSYRKQIEPNVVAIDLLGTFQVRVGDTPVTDFHSAKVRGLLAYLAVETNRSHGRELLAGLLWPNESGEKALTNLRQGLHRLSHALEASNLDTQPLVVSRQAIQIRPGSCRLDVTLFLAEITAAEQHAHRRVTACRSCLERLRNAAALYRGDFLAGFSADSGASFEEWLLVWRERLRERCAWALATLAEHHVQRGEHTPAAAYLRCWLELEPWNEEAHKRLITLLASTGQRSAALAQYEHCRRSLAQELDATPGLEIEALVVRVRAGRLPAPATPLYSVPVPPTANIGRDAELTAVATHMASNACRLLTIVGAGGSGKTRLSLEAAAAERGAFADGIVFVELAALPFAEQLAPALAAHFALPIAEQGQSTISLLRQYLRNREMLIVLDNFEHIIGAASLLGELLAVAPRVSMQVTSREPLRLAAEWLVRVNGLELPPEQAHAALVDIHSGNSSEELPGDYPAVQLFMQTVRQANPVFVPGAAEQLCIARICRAVDGLPLAINLAAGLVASQTLASILGALQHFPDYLATTLRDTPERHHSLRALFDSSWRLLTPLEQHVLAHRSVFAGEFSCDAIAAILPDHHERSIGGDSPIQSHEYTIGLALSALAAKSLIQHGTNGRYTLHDLVYRFAAKQLAAHAKDAARRRHSAFFLQQVAYQAGVILGPHGRWAVDALRADIHEVRLAWRRAIEYHDIAGLHASVGVLLDFARMSGLCSIAAEAFSEASDWLRMQPTTGKDEQRGQSLLAALLAAHAETLYTCGIYPALITIAQEARALAHTIGEPLQEATALLACGKAHWRQGNNNEAVVSLSLAWNATFAVADAGDLAHQRLRSDIHYYQGLVCWNQGLFRPARAHYTAALHLARSIGYCYGEADALNNLALVEIFQGEYADGRTHAEAALAIYRATANRAGEGLGLSSLGAAQMYCGEDLAAHDTLSNCLRIHQENGDRQNVSMAYILLGMMFTRVGDYVSAGVALQSGIVLCREIDHRWALSVGLAYEGLRLHLLGDQQGAATYCQEALMIAGQTGDPVVIAYALTHLGHTLASQNIDATFYYEQAVTLRRAIGQHHLAPEALAGLARQAQANGNTTLALAYVSDMLQTYAATQFAGIEEPGRVIATCYAILEQHDDMRAAPMLEAAKRQIEQRGERLTGSGLQGAFWAIAANRELPGKV